MKKFYQSLNTRVLVGSTAVLVTLAVVFTIFFVRKEMQIIEQSLLERGRLLASYTADNARVNLLTRDRKGLIEDAEVTCVSPDMVQVVFLDPNGNFIAGRNRSGEIALVPGDVQPLQKTEGYALRTVGGQNIYTFHHKVSFAAPQTGEQLFDDTGNKSSVAIGWVRVDLSGATIEREMHVLLRNNIAIAVAVTLILSLVLYLFLLRQIGQPLQDVREVVKAAKEISKGNLDQKINVRYSDEIGMLADTFNQMTRSIKEREEELLKLAAAVECTDEAMVIADIDGKVIYANPAFEEVTGYSRNAVKGTPLSRYLTADDTSGEHQMLAEAVHKGESCSAEIQNRRKDGALFLADQSVSPILNGEGRQVYTLLVIRDITEKDQLEKSLIQSQKMEAIGTLAGGIAHDFNNLLGGILGYASLLRIELDAKGIDAAEYLDVIEKLSRRAAKTTHHLLGYAQRGKYRNEQVNLNVLVEELTDFLRNTVDRRIAIETALAQEPPLVQADSNQLYQVLLNICLNSRDSMPEGGRLFLQTDVVSVNGTGVRHHGEEVPAGRYVRVVVTDTGTGMDKDTKARIFEPFFTTKETGKGTGLGLAMVYGIVTNHGGFIQVDSEPDKGTTFSVYLPEENTETAQARLEDTHDD